MVNSTQWGDLVDAAKATVSKAENGDIEAGKSVIVHSTSAMRALLERGVSPNPRDAVYLASLIDGLGRIVDGVEPARALNLEKPWNRPSSENTEVRDALIFIQVGDETDALRCTVNDAIEAVAERNGLGAETVRKAWQAFGSMEGWNLRKAEGK